MRKLVSLFSVTFLLALSASVASPQTVMRQTASGDGVFHLKEVQAIITSANDSVKVLMVLPTDMRPEGYRDIEIKNNDEILMINKKRIKSVKTLEKMYNDLEIGGEFKMGLRRDGKFSLVAFKKIDPADLPAGAQVQIRTASDAGGEGHGAGFLTRTIAGNAGEMANMRPLFGTGLVLRFEDGKVKIADVMDHAERIVGKADLQSGDIVESINGNKAKSLDQIVDLYEKFAVGTQIDLAYLRKGKKMKVSFEKPQARGQMMIRQD